ncbi:hypothetical protein [Streptosporangium sp. V21-05]|uniref:hypothetical protein n=1 Tax=Streptosporangium sp. V21-05 TaxID=3446115 RepID=UPI003F535874
MTASLAQVAADVTGALRDRDLERARGHFDRAVQGNEEVLSALLKELAATIEIPVGVVVVGFGIDVWNNPWRDGYAWRCGSCRWTGSNYLTPRTAQSAATKHAAEHQEPKPTVCDYAEMLSATPAATVAAPSDTGPSSDPTADCVPDPWQAPSGERVA